MSAATRSEVNNQHVLPARESLEAPLSPRRRRQQQQQQQQLEGSWIPAGPPPAGVDDSTRAPQRPLLDDCEKMGTLFGMINKCLRGLGFSQMQFADRTVEPVVVLLFWLLLWFLGVQALGLVGALCIIIIYIQKD